LFVLVSRRFFRTRLIFRTFVPIPLIYGQPFDAIKLTGTLCFFTTVCCKSNLSVLQGVKCTDNMVTKGPMLQNFLRPQVENFCYKLKCLAFVPCKLFQPSLFLVGNQEPTLKWRNSLSFTWVGSLYQHKLG
jgi:hypothetical protein